MYYRPNEAELMENMRENLGLEPFTFRVGKYDWTLFFSYSIFNCDLWIWKPIFHLLSLMMLKEVVGDVDRSEAYLKCPDHIY